jgi:glycosyltransferase involved in cell wall biosynthesis
MRVYIYPDFKGEDDGDGGVRRVVEMQRSVLPEHGIEIVPSHEEADAVIVHIERASKYLRQYKDLPLILDCHGLYWADIDPATGRPYEWPAWAIKANAQVMESIRHSDAVIAHSFWVAQAIRRHTMRKVGVIPHGIDAAEWPASDRSEYGSGYVLWNKTRPDPICDPTPIVKLAEAMPDIKFVTTFDLHGESPPNLQVTGRLPFVEAKQLVQAAGIYLCTARETFGVGTLEAMAAGVPIVGWAWGGQREFLKHKDTAWLAAPGDHDGLIEGVRWAFENHDRLSRRSREVAGAFSYGEVGKMYATFLQSVVSEWKERRSGPRVSIIVTAYNLADYLPDCLDSVLAQKDDDFECIVVDDASPDRCGAIADEYAKKDERVRVIHNKKNQYLAMARNTGIAQARGRYILPLDADDMLTPRTVGLLADALDEDRGLHITYGNVLFVDEDGETPTEYNVQGVNPGHSGWPMVFKYEWQEVQRNLLPYCSMFRREVWERTGGYRARCRTAEDAEFWTRAASYGFRPKMVSTADTLIYRNREGSMSREVGQREWSAWFPWSTFPDVRPAGAVAAEQPPMHSCDPPIIAVVIPVGPGHEELIWDAVDSVDAQTFRQWECIVVNDTGKTLPRQLPSWVTVIDAGRRSLGVAAARNKGIARSRARLFLPLDADDYLQPQCLQEMFEAWSEVGGIVYSDWYDEAEGGQQQIFEAEDFDPSTYMTHLRTKGCLHAVTALYPKRIWEEVGGFDEELPAWEDWDFQLAAANIGECSTRIPHPLWVYRKSTGYRREENYAEHEESKQGILRKWKRFFGGEQELMACSGCTKRQRVPVAQALTKKSPAAQVSTNGEAVLIEYTGEQSTRHFRAPSGQAYSFGAGRNNKKYVRAEDAAHFANMRDFRQVAPQEVAATPELVAEGPPR